MPNPQAPLTREPNQEARQEWRRHLLALDPRHHEEGNCGERERADAESSPPNS